MEPATYKCYTLNQEPSQSTLSLEVLKTKSVHTMKDEPRSVIGIIGSDPRML